MLDFRFETFWRDEKTSDVDVKSDKVYIKRFTTHPAKQIFCADEMSRFELGDIVLKSRCFDKNRPDCNELLEHMGLEDYDVYKICRKTHGIMVQDFIWFRYEGEDIQWSDIEKLKGLR